MSVRGSGKKKAVKDVRRGLGVECHAGQSGKRIMTLGKAEAGTVRGGRRRRGVNVSSSYGSVRRGRKGGVGDVRQGWWQ